MPLPPKLVRRLVIAPLVVILAVAVVMIMPIGVAAAAFASRFVPGRWRPLRLLWFFFVYLMLEVIVLAALLGLWIGTGFGWRIRAERSQAWHYALTAWFLRRIMGSARRTFHLSLDTVGKPLDLRDRPHLLFARHAGPGDSLILVDLAMNTAHRRPRIVLKDILQFEPAFDVLLNRVPNRFVPHGPEARQATIDAIAVLAGTAGPLDALVLFPEGANFTPKRRERAIAKLDERGRADLADRARDLQHLLPPRAAGALAAIDAAPTADIVFVGHAGLEELSTIGDVWRGLPMDFDVRVRSWVVRAEDVPPAGQREAWLFDQWATIDAWLIEQMADTNATT